MRGSKLFLSIIFGIGVITIIVVVYLFSTLSFKNVDPFNSIPEKSVVSILKVKSFNHLKSTLSDTVLSKEGLFNNFLLQHSENIFKNIEKIISSNVDSSNLSEFKNRSFLISAHFSSDSTLQFLYTFSIKNRLETRFVLEQFKGNNQVVKEQGKGDIELYGLTTSEKFPLYFTINEGIISLSFSKELLTDAYKQQFTNGSVLTNRQLKQLIDISKNSDFDNLYVNSVKFKKLGLQLLSQEWHEHLALLQNYERWIQYDIDYKQRQLTFNGVFISQKDSNKENLFKAGSSQLSLDRVYPSEITSFFNYSFDKSGFDKNFPTFAGLDGVDSLPFVKMWLSLIEPEFGIALFKCDSVGIVKRALFQKLTSSDKILQQLNKTIEFVETWQVDNSLDLSIYKLYSPELLNSVYGSFFENFPSKYLIVFERYLILSDDLTILKKIYLDYLRGNTLSNNLIYREYRQNFPDRENLFIYSICNSGNFISKTANMPIKKSTEINLFGAQLTYSDSVAYTSIVIEYDIKMHDFSNVKWISSLDTIVAIEPKIVIHPTDNIHYILVQDAKNQLYLISDIGRVLWKRPLDGRIMGEISQFHIMGKPQNVFLFNTPDKIYQLNFDGNNVGNFPVLLPSKATSSISLFDYEQNGDYRLFIPSKDKEIRVYDNKGNIVTGFQTANLSGEIHNPIQHFTASEKDYIILNDGYATRILDRKGNDRIKPSKEFDKREDTPYYLVSEDKKSFFVTSDVDGNIVKIGIPDGEVLKIRGLEMATNHMMFPILTKDKSVNYLFVTNRMLRMVSSEGKVLYEKEIKVNDIFNIKLFGDSKVGFYISFLDRSSSLIFIYNVENGELLNGFPKYGEQNYTLRFSNDQKPLIYSGTNYHSMICF